MKLLYTCLYQEFEIIVSTYVSVKTDKIADKYKVNTLVLPSNGPSFLLDQQVYLRAKLSLASYSGRYYQYLHNQKISIDQ